LGTELAGVLLIVFQVRGSRFEVRGFTLRVRGSRFEVRGDGRGGAEGEGGRSGTFFVVRASLLVGGWSPRGWLEMRRFDGRRDFDGRGSGDCGRRGHCGWGGRRGHFCCDGKGYFCWGGGVVYFAGQAGRGDVDADGVEDVGRGRALADDFAIVASDVEAFGVGGGELEAEEEGVGALGVDEVTGEGVDDLGDGELDGDAVFHGGQGDDVAAVEQIAAADQRGAVEAVALVELAVEVAEDGFGECSASALEAVGLDVAADRDLHGEAPLGGTPPGGGGRK
jgi:hypothetical protein